MGFRAADAGIGHRAKSVHKKARREPGLFGSGGRLCPDTFPVMSRALLLVKLLRDNLLIFQ